MERSMHGTQKGGDDEQGAEVIHRALRTVGGYMHQAMVEAASKHNEPRLTQYIEDMYDGEQDILPHVDYLQILETIEPGTADAVLLRTDEIQQEHNRRFYEEHFSRKARYKRIARATLRSLFG